MEEKRNAISRRRERKIQKNICKQHDSMLLKSWSLRVSYLLDILLEEAERQALMKFDLLLVPLGLQLSVVREDLMDHRQDMTGTLKVDLLVGIYKKLLFIFWGIMHKCHRFYILLGLKGNHTIQKDDKYSLAVRDKINTTLWTSLHDIMSKRYGNYSWLLQYRYLFFMVSS